MEAFPEIYARIKKATGYTGQAELAQRLGIPQALISDSRRRGEVRSEILLALLEQFNVSPQWVQAQEKGNGTLLFLRIRSLLCME